MVHSVRFFKHRGRVFFGAAAMIAALTGFFVLARAVHLDATASIDRTILTAIHNQATPLFDVVFQLVTRTGDTLVIGILTAGITLYLLYLHRYRQAIFLVVSLAGAGTTTTLLKLAFERARPELWVRLTSETTFSFPSGHAVGSVVLAFSLVLLLWNTRWRWAAIVGGAIYVLLIGLSRLYLGVHYPSDVLAGWCVAVTWVLLAAGLVAFWRARYNKTHEENTSHDPV